MAETFKLVFRGDIAPGHNIAEVRQRVAGLFNLDEETVGQFFSGRPVAIRRNLSEEEARKWLAVLLKAGIIVAARRDDGDAPAPAAGTPAVVDSGGLGIAPAGADVLRPDERSVYKPVQVNTDHLSLDQPGADVLRPEERRCHEELELDLSHLRLEDQP